MFTTKAFSSNLASNRLSPNNGLTGLNNYLHLYLTSHSLALLKDPNCRLINVLRHYLLNFPKEFENDIESRAIPDIKTLKKGVNEVLNSWSSIVVELIESFSNNYFRVGFDQNLMRGLEFADGLNFNNFYDQNVSTNYRFLTEIRQNKEASDSFLRSSNKPEKKSKFGTLTKKDSKKEQSPPVSINSPKSAIKTESNTKEMIINENSVSNSLSNVTAAPPTVTFADVKQNEPETSNISDSNKNQNETVNAKGYASLSPSSDESNDDDRNMSQNFNSFSFTNYDKGSILNRDKSSTDEYEKTLHSCHVGPQLKTSSKLFKPILNFIGIDAPSSTLMDNLFKEFGSYLFGNLNIKSVDINILGKQSHRRQQSEHQNLSTLKRSENNFRSFHVKKSPSAQQQSEVLFRTIEEKVITTILSFDSLQLNVNVRQVLPESLNFMKAIQATAAQTPQPPPQRSHNRLLSMVNPVYTGGNPTTSAPAPVQKSLAFTQAPKYHTKIDIGIRLNNLSQEVNMPLLRLAHQLYSIVADGIEYDKEQTKMIIENSFRNDLNNTGIGIYAQNFDEIDNDLHFLESGIHKSSFKQSLPMALPKDSWRFMDNLIELRDYMPLPKIHEKNEVNPDGAPKSKYKLYTKNVLYKEKSQVSLFGWINIKQVNSKAGLGTLAFNGQMKNIQLSVLFGQKVTGFNLDKRHLEGSLNLCMDSTSGKLTENDSQKNVVMLNVGRCHLFALFKKQNFKNMLSSFVHVGLIDIDVPLRPMVVHGVVYRESKVIEQNILPEIKNFVIFDSVEEASNNQADQSNADSGTKAGQASSTSQMDSMNASKHSNFKVSSRVDGKEFLDPDSASKHLNAYQRSTGKQQHQKTGSSQFNTPRIGRHIKTHSIGSSSRKVYQRSLSSNSNNPTSLSMEHFIFDIKSKLDGCEIRAKLLETPSLKAAYIIKDVTCSASVSPEKSQINCFLSSHCLSFNTDDDFINEKNFRQSTRSKTTTASGSLSEATNFSLPSISLTGSHVSKLRQLDYELNASDLPHGQHLNPNQHANVLTYRKILNNFEIQLKVKIAPLCRELNAEVIAQLVFVTKIFIKEINHILQSVYFMEGTKQQEKHEPATTPLLSSKPSFHNQHSLLSNQSSVISRVYYHVQIELGKISLTGITPTKTALTVCTGDQNLLVLTNNLASETTHSDGAGKAGHSAEEFVQDYTLKPSIDAKCKINVELKTSFKTTANTSSAKDQPSARDNRSKSSKSDDNPSKQGSIHTSEGSIDEDMDWYQLAYFDTKFELKNTIKVLQSGFDREAIIINVEKPRFYLQPGAVDNAIIFWLNYKNTYEYWLQQRQQFSNLLIDQEELKNSAASIFTHTTASSNDTQHLDVTLLKNFLALKLRVTGLGLALPLSNVMTKDFFRANTDCLVITLNETAIYACSSGCVVSKGQFNNFCLRFTENFNLSSSEWTPTVYQEMAKGINGQHAQSKPLMNAWIVPSGSYEVCSSTIEQLQQPAVSLSAKKMSPIWILSVKWKMEGIEVNLDTVIGKWLSKMADTVTRLAETQNITEATTNSTDQDLEIKKLRKELKHYKEIGDSVKINQLQSKLDVLSVASYPEKAKQMFLKTRNNLKGQFGFKNQLPGSNAHSQVDSDSSDNSKQAGVKTPLESTRRHSRSQSGDYKNQRRHSISNDDTSLPSYYKNSRGNQDNRVSFMNQHSMVIEETENELANSSINLNKSPNDPTKRKQSLNDDPKVQNQNTSSFKRHSQIAPTTAPAIDFKLDVKIEINSGKCVLHAAKMPNENYYDGMRHDHHMNHPFNGAFGMPFNASTNPTTNMSSDQDMKNTNFIFPAIRVKAFYESTHQKVNNRLSKKANLYAMIRIESFIMPSSFSHHMIHRDFFSSRDMIISPALLDFLEQTLEPLTQIKSSFESATSSSNVHGKSKISPGSQKSRSKLNGSESARAYESPEDESDILTETNSDNDNDNESELDPQSYQNDSQLQLQSQEAIYFPVDVVVFVSMLPSSIRFTCLPQSTMECLLKLPTLEMVFSTNRMNQKLQEDIYNRLDEKNMELVPFASTSPKLNTQSSEKFPSTKPADSNDGGLSVTCSMSDFSVKFYNRLGIRNNNEARFYYNDQSNFPEEKDTLSVRVAYIKVNISRSRRTVKKILSISDENEDTSDTSTTMNDVQLSILADIGSSSFIYDMRNIKEVFVFPKIWFRRSLARRVFLGEDTATAFDEDEESVNENDVPNQSSNTKSYGSRSASERDNAFRSKLAKPSENELVRATKANNLHRPNSNWQTLVLLSINLVGLEVKMNIGNVMGNVVWLSKKARASSKISVNSYGNRHMLFNFVLDSSKLIAEGGSNGCLLRIQDIIAMADINDRDKITQAPSHKLEFGVFATECRIDNAYNQATPILAFRLSSLNLKLNDSWERNKTKEAILEMNVTWDQLHLMITKSTTPDLIILYYKLIDYFEKQFTESKDYIKEWDLDLFYEMKVKQQFIETKEVVIKRNFNVNGGNVQLKGNNFTLITFHGNNFKANTWAVFSLNEPSMDFATQSFIRDEVERVQQNLSFYLGRSQKKIRDMASIYMVTRETTSIFTRYQTINEWFEYAHSTIDAAGLRDFPRFASDENSSMLSQINKKSKMSDQTKSEEIFHLPSLQVHCDTTIEKNHVKFEFKTDFHDHILLTFRTEHFGFLHKLITSYIKEKDIIRGKDDFIPPTKKDERVYECIKWELEPTLRLISKFGSSVEPPGVDALLKSLGFHHARTTIPKWLQRGLIDNLNDLMYKLIKVYIKILAEQASEKELNMS